MGEVKLFLKLLVDKEAERELYRLLKRYRGKIVAVAVAIEVEDSIKARAIAGGYKLKSLPLHPAALFIENLEQ